MRLNGKHKRILVISDLQFPCHHRDTFKFLKAMKKKYKPDLVVQIGDLADFGSMSSFDFDPDYVSPKDELTLVKKNVAELSKLFPDMYITLGNHEMRLYRKALKAGLPVQVLKDFDVIVGAPKSWKFVERIKYNWEDVRRRILFVHTGSGATTKQALAPRQHANVVHGHIHTNFWVKWSSTADALHWDMNVGCMIDDDSIVFKYNRLQTARPILGCAMIENNQPVLVPMLLNKKGRWIKTFMGR